MQVSAPTHGQAPTTKDDPASTSTRPALPVGSRSPISASALSTQRQHLRPAPRKPEREPPRSSANRQALDAMIADNRATPSGTGAFLLSNTSLGSAEHMPSQAYHTRVETQAPVFFSEYATEKPSLSMVAELPQDKRDYYAVRHVGKRGRDLYTDLPIEGSDSRAGQLKTSPLLSTQSRGTRAIRGFAATATIDQSRGEYIARLHRHVVNVVGGAADQTVHLVRPSRDPYVADSTLNFFTFCEQTELARALNDLEARTARQEQRPPIVFSDNKSLIGLSRTSRTEASPIGRLVQQPFFVTSELRPGDKVVIADDHIQAGGSMLAMESAALDAGADVLAFATLSAHPFSPQLTMAAEVRQLLGDTLATWDPGHLVTSRLAELGMPPERLTNSEALILIAYATDPSDTQAVARFEGMQAKFFERAHLHNIGVNPDAPDAETHLEQVRARQETFGTDTARAFIGNAHVLEGQHDSLSPVLRQSPKSPEQIVAELDQVSRSSRASVKGSEVKQVVVLDWDDCLRDEKGLNYQLMHNALVVAAREHAVALPELGDAVSRLKARMQTAEKPCDGDPLLMKGQAEFSQHLLAHPNMYKRHIIEDFVHKMLPDLPVERARTVVNTAYSQFARQYKALTQPQSGDKPRDLPFPDVQFQLMPGARELLEHSRTADSRVILISNRGQADLQDEVNHLGMNHYFDVVSGAPLRSVPKPGAEAPPMSDDLQQRLTQTLRNGDEQALHQVLQEAADHAHPDTTRIDRGDKKPGAARLMQSLQELSVPPQVPVTSIGDQASDVQQLAALAGTGRRLEGVIVNSARGDLGQTVDVAGIPTRVVHSMNDV